jgi:hypothetical protein
MVGTQTVCQHCGSPLDLTRVRVTPEACTKPGFDGDSIRVAPCSSCGREHCLECGKILYSNISDIAALARSWRARRADH